MYIYSLFKKYYFIFFFIILFFGKINYFFFNSNEIFESTFLSIIHFAKDFLLITFTIILLKFFDKIELDKLNIFLLLISIFIIKIIFYENSFEYSLKILRNYIFPLFLVFIFIHFPKKKSQNIFILFTLITIPFAFIQLIQINFGFTDLFLTQVNNRVNSIFDNPVLYSSILFLCILSLPKLSVQKIWYHGLLSLIFTFMILSTLSISVILIYFFYCFVLFIYLFVDKNYLFATYMILITICGCLLFSFLPISYELLALKLINFTKYFFLIFEQEIVNVDLINDLNVLQESQFQTFKDKNVQIYNFLSFSCNSEIPNFMSKLKTIFLGCEFSSTYESEVSIISFLNYFGFLGLFCILFLYKLTNFYHLEFFHKTNIIFILSLVFTSTFFSYPLIYFVVYLLSNYIKND